MGQEDGIPSLVNRRVTATVPPNLPTQGAATGTSFTGVYQPTPSTLTAQAENPQLTIATGVHHEEESR
jgi:hypothetical protein